MTIVYNLRASTNVSFRWTRDLSKFQSLYNISASTLRMQARATAASADPPVYEWSSSNTRGGLVSFDAATGLCVFSAPETDMAQMPAHLVYDCRMELPNGAVVPLFAGQITFSQSVTRTSSLSGASGNLALSDTVGVAGEGVGALTPLPLSLSSVLAIAQGAASAAQTAAAKASSAAAGSNGLISALIYG
ncbi:hypothetical protein SAMN06265338_101722 [Rhodoblastus acidophilus]|uniref:Uncharacterized protein n=2 Tax=Rhodoblastus acidophilus TaxID=1074 RepID=A0A212QLF0_RHOAC|nr:hypothetical protein CKO16_03475 [Rhodoblastus acidophilus]SNB60058.1 hypothetical protein SAMN06265338_101722 [Rhodoblastus acidophilus]